jgi:hypothetical protein
LALFGAVDDLLTAPTLRERCVKPSLHFTAAIASRHQKWLLQHKEKTVELMVEGPRKGRVSGMKSG